jgi:hypothetical protein
MLQEAQYEFAQVFLEHHSYTLPEKRPAERPNTGRFTSPYRDWREQYQQGHTAPAEALLEQYRHINVYARIEQAIGLNHSAAIRQRYR